MKKQKPLKIVLSVIAAFLALVLAFVGGFLIYASSTALNVQPTEEVGITGNVAAKVDASKPFTLLTWNIGYGALDAREDCYWDGGAGVVGESEQTVLENLTALKAKIGELNPDAFFLQEADVASKRSYYVDEYKAFQDAFNAEEYNSSFALNFKAGCVPLPLYNFTGKVEAGIASFSKYAVSEATRVQLPCPFSWPMSTVNLKRCLLVNRLPVEGSDKELVLINLHLEAYDNGEGKAKQLAMLMDFMKAEYEKGNFVVAGGDFNQTFSNTDYQQFPQITTWECPVIEAGNYPDFTFMMDSAVPTCRSLDKPYAGADPSPEAFQYWMLDGFIVSNNVKIERLETLDLGFQNTDHNPVVMQMNIEE